MVHAELRYNPYLLKTDVMFNGQLPKINSQIEKYAYSILKDWVDLIPGIFYDEMNGFDFDLNFTGTKPDFEEVCLAFQKAGISQNEVRLFLKNELEDAETKSREIGALVEWIDKHKNRRFDWESFWEKHHALFEGKIPYIVIRGTLPEIVPSQYAIEQVHSADELKGTLLTNTPVLFLVEEDSVTQFRQDLITILNRKDICQKQLFFLFQASLNKEQTARVIFDLGVEKPQIVEKIDDEIIIKYIQNYPMTEYIREVIRIMEEEIAQVEQVLEAENRESEVTNADIHARIELLEREILELKRADMAFVERDNFYMPQVFRECMEKLEDQIRRWRNRKTKVTGDYEAEIAAAEYDSELKKYMDCFLETMKAEGQKICSEIMRSFKRLYETPGIDCEYVPSGIYCKEPFAPVSPSLTMDLIGMKEITYEESRNDLLNFFLKPAAKEEKKPVRVATCYYEKWRNKASSVLLPIAQLYAREYTDKLREYCDQLAENFHQHLTELIESKSSEKETVSAQLSDDERRLQEDNDWLNAVKEQLIQIERG